MESIEKTTTDVVLWNFINYHHPKDPTYISNLEIKLYLEKHKIFPSSKEFQILKSYMLEEKKLSRKIFSELENSHKTEKLDPPKEKEEEKAKEPQITNTYPKHLEEFMNSLIIRRYSKKTIKNYKLSLVVAHRWFLKNKGTPLQKINQQQLFDFFLHLTKVKEFSASSIRIYRFALELYFSEIMVIHLNFQPFKSLKKSEHIPTVLSKREIQKLFSVIQNLKHRLILSFVKRDKESIINISVASCTLEILYFMIYQTEFILTLLKR